MTWYVVDGIDGSGKSTVGDELRNYLESKGRKVYIVTHPDESKFIGRLEARLLHKDIGKLSEIMTTFAYIGDIMGSLVRMKVLGDRYDDFIFVRYSMAAAYVPEPLCFTAYRIIRKVLPNPDVRIFVDVDADTAMSRIDSRGGEKELFETMDKLTRVRNRMLKMAEQGWHILDNTGGHDKTRAGLHDIVDRTSASPSL